MSRWVGKYHGESESRLAPPLLRSILTTPTSATIYGGIVFRIRTCSPSVCAARGRASQPAAQSVGGASGDGHAEGEGAQEGNRGPTHSGLVGRRRTSTRCATFLLTPVGMGWEYARDDSDGQNCEGESRRVGRTTVRYLALHIFMRNCTQNAIVTFLCLLLLSLASLFSFLLLLT